MFMLTTLVLYPLITTTLYYLGYQALITKFLWSHYPVWLNSWARCAACSGAWYGAAVAAAYGYGLHLPFLGLPGARWSTVATVALLAAFWTPVLSWLHLRALDAIGSDPPIEVEVTPVPPTNITPIKRPPTKPPWTPDGAA